MPLRFQSIPFFAHDDERCRGPVGLEPNFGLRDSTWSELLAELQRLDRKHPGATHKLVYLARHGEGYHNLAEQKYGKSAWDSYWSLRNGDGEMCWGPDPYLTPLGVDQANRVHTALMDATSVRTDAPPLPAKLLSSPFTRALDTLYITWRGILLRDVGTDRARPSPGGCDQQADSTRQQVRVMELLRETIGEHTCDKRSSMAEIVRRFPLAQREGKPTPLVFDPCFAEEDCMWKPDHRETDDAMRSRIQAGLEQVWSECSESQVLSITCHSGVIQRVLEITQHVKVDVAVGGTSDAERAS